jgi:hypothetical protein
MAMDFDEISKKLKEKRNDLELLDFEYRKANETSKRSKLFVLIRFTEDVFNVGSFWKSFYHISEKSPRQEMIAKIGIEDNEVKHRTKKYTEFEINKMISDIGKNIEIIGEYTTKETPTLFRNNDCGHKFLAPPQDIYNGPTVCRVCCKYGESYVEKLISSFLDSIGIEYEREKPMDGMRYKNPLRFDFYIESHNVAIEYHGRQHYDKNSGFYEEAQKERDGAKRKFCLDNEIKLTLLQGDEK